MKRRNLLKMLGVSPALLAPWKPASEKAAPAPVPPAKPDKLTFEEAMRLVDWDKELQPSPAIIVDQSTEPFLRPLRAARTYAATGMVGYGFDLQWRGDDGPV